MAGSEMYKTLCSVLASASLLTVVLLSSSSHVNAAESKMWNTRFYAVSMEADVEDLSLDVSGSMKYSIVNPSAVEPSGTTSYRLFAVEGELSGSQVSTEGFKITSNVSIDGLVYETAQGTGLAREIVYTLMKSKYGVVGFMVSSQIEKEVVTTFTPPFLSKLRSDLQLGESWSETTSSRTVTSMWVNGRSQGTSEANLSATYEVAIGTSMESVSTAAGYFDAERIEVTDSSGDRQVLWWSDREGVFVKMLYYHNESAAPYKTMALSGLSADASNKVASDSEIILFGVGLGAVVIACIVLAAVISMRGPKSRRPPPDPHAITYALEADHSRSNI